MKTNLHLHSMYLVVLRYGFFQLPTRYPGLTFTLEKIVSYWMKVLHNIFVSPHSIPALYLWMYFIEGEKSFRFLCIFVFTPPQHTSLCVKFLHFFDVFLVYVEKKNPDLLHNDRITVLHHHRSDF